MKQAIRQAAFVLLTAAFVAATSATALAGIPFFSKDELPSLAPMLEGTTPAIVSIAVKGTQPTRQQVPEMFRYFFGAPNNQAQERPFRGLGSGVIIDASKGYIVTNNHVVDNADEILVKLTDGRELVATKLGADEQSDIALLQIDAERLNELKVADSNNLRVGDFVVAIGNPFGLSQTVTSGIVSALGRSGLNIGGYEDFIQTDAAINRGNSGGALVNLRGELVGINTAIFGPNGGNVGIGFAIPSNMMQSLVDQIIEFGEVRRGLLGIVGRDVDAGLAEAFNSQVNIGAFVNEVAPGTAAEKAGLQAGDIISEINGNSLSGFNELRAKIASLGAGAEVELTVIRAGKTQKVDVVLDAAAAALAEAKEVHPALEGATLSNGKDSDGKDAVIIDEVAESSPAAGIGLREDDIIVGVNRNRVDNISELTERIADKKDVIALNVKRGNSNLYIVIR
ncbi:protease do [Glaciecola punicea ACAM 611]|jgi:serine protease DegQ|uniref:Protease do n=1 Tax=Glaciecola punicea ACAM 611 TaxID=1121923 RepID=H5T8H4_9ALTE|nr:DegQ family serine endoprotease [Glaciecola punicea]OFA30510.1 serine endoprotease DegQ [Glaciecola punicea]GAB54615.1 protease do [Glaciecola punicea ACAM 611]